MLVHCKRDLDDVIVNAGVAADAIVAEVTADATADVTAYINDVLFPLRKRFHLGNDVAAVEATWML